MNSVCLLTVVVLFAGIVTSADATPSRDYAKDTHPGETAIVFNAELSQPGATYVGDYLYACRGRGCRYTICIDFRSIKGRQACMLDVAYIEQRRRAAAGNFHGLGALIGNVQIDQAPQFLWVYHGMIAGYSQ